MIPLYRYNWKLESWEKDSDIEYDPDQQAFTLNMFVYIPAEQSYFFSGDALPEAAQETIH